MCKNSAMLYLKTTHTSDVTLNFTHVQFLIYLTFSRKDKSKNFCPIIFWLFEKVQQKMQPFLLLCTQNVFSIQKSTRKKPILKFGYRVKLQIQGASLELIKCENRHFNELHSSKNHPHSKSPCSLSCLHLLWLCLWFGTKIWLA